MQVGFEDVFSGEPGLLATLCEFLWTQEEVLVGIATCSTKIRDALRHVPLNLSQDRSRRIYCLQLETITALPAKVKEVHVDIGHCCHDSLQGLNSNLEDCMRRVCSRICHMSSQHTLEKITIHQPLKGLQDLSSFSVFANLKELHVNWAASVSNLDSVSACTKLQVLNLTGCGSLRDISALDRCTSLESLTLRGCSNLQDVTALGNCAWLEHLEIGSCTALENIDFMKQLTKIKHFALEGNLKISSLEALGQSPSAAILQVVHLKWCTALVSTQGLAACHALRDLDLSGSCQVSDLSCLEMCEKLQHLNLYECPLVMDLSSIGKHHRLHSLCTGGPSINFLPPENIDQLKRTRFPLNMPRCESLRHLSFSGLPWMVDLGFLTLFPNLVSLKVMACPNLTDIRHVRHLFRLKEASFKRCRSIRDISPLYRCPCLTCVDVTGCSVGTLEEDITSIKIVGAAIPKRKQHSASSSALKLSAPHSDAKESLDVTPRLRSVGAARKPRLSLLPQVHIDDQSIHCPNEK